VISWQAQALTECWYKRCRVDGALVGADMLHRGQQEEGTVRLCGVHAQLVALYLARPDVEVQLRQSVLGLPVLVIVGLQPQG
jgi:hypothetical protein